MRRIKKVGRDLRAREIAVNAKKSKIHFYSVCEDEKINLLSYLGKKVELKQGFDFVSSDLLSGIITEHGILNSKTIPDLMKEKLKFFEVPIRTKITRVLMPQVL